MISPPDDPPRLHAITARGVQRMRVELLESDIFWEEEVGTVCSLPLQIYDKWGVCLADENAAKRRCKRWERVGYFPAKTKKFEDRMGSTR